MNGIADSMRASVRSRAIAVQFHRFFAMLYTLLLIGGTTALQPGLAQPRIMPITSRRTAIIMLRVGVGDQIVAGNDWNSSSPSYGIVRAQSYELQRVYYQGVVDGKVAKVDVNELEAPPPPGCAGFRKFLVLFSQRYHGETAPVVVTESEVKIVTMRDEIADSAWLAIPGLFWVWLAYTFYQYGVERGFIF